MNRIEEIDALAPWTRCVPRGWNVSRLDNVADVLFSNVDKHSIEGETPVLLCNYVDVYKNERIKKTINFMEATAEPREIDKFQIRLGDVLVTKDSEDPNDIAIPALVVEELPGVICGYHLALIRTRSRLITGDFLAWLHRSKQFRAQYEAKAVGVTRFGLSQYAFRSALIPIPPINEQFLINTYLDQSCTAIDSIASIVKGKEDSINTNGILNQQMRTIRAYRNSLIHECVTGQRRITEADLARVQKLKRAQAVFS
jgi:type I restriction enzyme, S subunit